MVNITESVPFVIQLWQTEGFFFLNHRPDIFAILQISLMLEHYIPHFDQSVRRLQTHPKRAVWRTCDPVIAKEGMGIMSVRDPIRLIKPR